MRIAVTSQNFRTVTGHAGRARRFIVFEVAGGEAPRQVGQLDLDADMAIHGFDHRARHPLDDMDVLITGGAGEGFVRHLAARGVQVVATAESDPQLAVAAFLAGRIMSASGSCNHDHGDLDAEGHDHDHGVGSAHACNCHG
ncbi:MAG: NifB/NifX family molybdenum-iron cluster-binding protein [Rhodocyclaceae bacterium]|nr:NifB/NifX family molybdenum-iron cluster-binding protein [Rhodocyclaceae bacterium]